MDVDSAISVRDLKKSYGQTKAVDGVSFSVARGEVFGLLGPNGAGKTTTVECIEGLRRPDAGEITILGWRQGPDSGKIKEIIGLQLQSTGLFPKLTVRETIGMFGTLFPRALPTEHLIELVGLGEKARTAAGSLSGGQRQRLTVALALVNDPEIVFLDEPTTGLDPQARRALWDVVRDLRHRGKTVVLTTHYMEEAEELCDRVAVVDKGRIIELGSPAALVSKHFRESAIELAASAAPPLEELARLSGVSRVLTEDGHVTLYTSDVPATMAGLLSATTEGSGLRDLNVRRASLEDVFLKITGRRIRS